VSVIVAVLGGGVSLASGIRIKESGNKGMYLDDITYENVDLSHLRALLNTVINTRGLKRAAIS